MNRLMFQPLGLGRGQIDPQPLDRPGRRVYRDRCDRKTAGMILGASTRMNGWKAFLEFQGGEAASINPQDGPPRAGSFGDGASEYEALRDGPALVDRSYRGLLEVTGADRAGWLHNLTTNEVKNLGLGEGNYAFATNVKGRILFDLNVLIRKDAIWIDLDRRFLERAKAHFDKYTIMEDVQVVDRSEDHVRLGLVGRNALRMLEQLGAPQARAMSTLGMATVELQGTEVPILRHDFCGPLGVELFVPAEQAIQIWREWVDPGGTLPAIPVGDDAVQVHRIEAGLPWPDCEIADEVLPAETGQHERAVSFQKGCYLGQEVVERMRSRGSLARRLCGLRMEGDTVPPQKASLIGKEGQPVGRLTSVCRSMALSYVIGMGYVKTASCEDGTPLQVQWPDGQPVDAVVVSLPFTNPSDG